MQTMPSRLRDRVDGMDRPGTKVVIGAALATAGLLWHMHDPGTTVPGPVHTTLDSAVLTAAMMTLLLGASVNLVAERSLPQRRWLFVAEHIAGFVTLWLFFGVAASILARVAEGFVPRRLVFASLLGVAAVWQLSMTRRGFVERCGRLPLAPLTGWHASARTYLSGLSDARSWACPAFPDT
jgi:hypothetical protein